MNLITRLRATFNRSYQKFSKHLVEREYCVWLAPYLSPLCRPLGVLALTAIAALLCGLFVAPQGFVVFGSVIAVIAVGCIWPWFGTRGLSCQLSFAVTQTEEGKPVEAELVITNRWPWPVWGLAIEGGFDRVGQAEKQATVAISRVGGWSRGHYRWSFTPTVRGRYPITCPQLVTEFPFGLWKARKRVHVASSVIAWPARFPLPPLPLPSGTPSCVGQPSDCVVGDSGHRTTVREFRHGDSMRQIHWAKTALYDKLISYEREGLAVGDATITLDTHPSLHPESGPDSTLEWSIRIAASVGDALLRQGVGLTLVSHSARFRSIATGNNPSGMLDWLATLDTSVRSTTEGRTTSSPSYSLTALTAHITTDLSDVIASDSIVLLTEPNRPLTQCTRSATNGWMTVKPNADIATQIRKGWRNGPRRTRYA